MTPFYLPSCSPELDPGERLWLHTEAFIGPGTAGIEHFEHQMNGFIRNVDPEFIASITGYPSFFDVTVILVLC
ncbi:MAG: hypothetical protein AAFS10_07950 [Myxococcota bacterium]